MFLYLDPFGPTGCDFTLLEPFLTRNPQFSTEILLTLSMPGIPRLATRRAVEQGRQHEPIISSFHQSLTRVLGGEYWQEILWEKGISPKERDQRLIAAYKDKLKQYLPYVDSCPIRARTGKRVKYFMVFASRHSDALLLLNDAMAKAYSIGMHHADFANGLWQEVDWQEMRSVTDLERVIVEELSQHNGETRNSIWLRIVQTHFAIYLQKEYRSAIQHLAEEKKIIFISNTGRLNDEAKLYLAPPTLL